LPVCCSPANWYRTHPPCRRYLRDLNHDGDALEFGEVIVFAHGINQPQDVALLRLTLPTDFNEDNSVDAADYVAWRKLGGTQLQYDVWKNNYGASAASSISAQAVVPEPTGTVLLLTFAAVLPLFANPWRHTADRRR
jgi:hypothetical protein